jgi:hypothetical protein
MFINQFLFFFIPYFFIISPKGQTCSLIGSILDAETKSPLSYATVVVIQSQTGTIANKEGAFEITIPEDKIQSDTLEFSHLGYKKTKISVSDFRKVKNGQIELKVSPTALSDVVVLPKKYKLEKTGIFAKKPQGFHVTNVFNHKQGNYIENKNEKQGWIKSASFYIYPLGHPETPFRVRIMDVNSEKKCPGDDLLNENVIVVASGPGWIKVNLEKYNIVFPKEGAFVIMEWINSGDQYFYKHSKSRTNNKGETETFMGTYYGQSIGTILNQPKMITWGLALGGEWIPYNMYYKGYPNLMINTEVIFAK